MAQTQCAFLDFSSKMSFRVWTIGLTKAYLFRSFVDKQQILFNKDLFSN